MRCDAPTTMKISFSYQLDNGGGEDERVSSRYRDTANEHENNKNAKVIITKRTNNYNYEEGFSATKTRPGGPTPTKTNQPIYYSDRIGVRVRYEYENNFRNYPAYEAINFRKLTSEGFPKLMANR